MRDRPYSEFVELRDARRTTLRAEVERVVRGHDRLLLEIGCGHGHFLTAYAAAHPATFCLGIDLASDRIRRADKKRERAGRANLAFLRADAADFLAVLPAGIALVTVYILFPDPWPKTRHHKNRLMQADFLQALADRCAADARLYFRTDHADYFADASAVARDHPAWSVLPGAPWPFEYQTVFQSRAAIYQSMVMEKV